MAQTLAHLTCAALLASTVAAVASPLKLDFTQHRRPVVALARRANGALNIVLNENQQQNSYVVDLSVGTPEQHFQLILDTGSSDLWVPDVDDTACTDGSNACQFGTYDSSASSTFQVVSKGTFEIQYGDGSTNNGDYISDVVTIGGVEIQNVTLGLALDGSSVIPGETAQGLLGVGYTALSSSRGEFPTLVDDLFTNGVIDRRAFSLYLNDAESGQGSILFGGVDTDKYHAPLVTLPVMPDLIDGQNLFVRYLVDLTSVGFSGGSGSGVSALSPSNMATAALLDSGTTQTILDASIFNNIVKGLGATAVNADGTTVYVTACSLGDGDAALVYQFGGSNGPTIKVPLSAVLEDVGEQFSNGDEICILLMRATDSSLPNTILGDSFLRSAYVVYDLDNNEISIAQANLNSTSSNIKVIPSGTAGLAEVSSTATATASPFTLDQAAASTGVLTEAPTGESAPTALPSSAGVPTFSGVSGGSGSAASSSGSASHLGGVSATPLGMMSMGAFISVAACFFAGMLVL